MENKKDVIWKIVWHMALIILSIILGSVIGYNYALGEAYEHKAGTYVIVNRFGKVEFKWLDELENKDLKQP